MLGGTYIKIVQCSYFIDQLVQGRTDIQIYDKVNKLMQGRTAYVYGIVIIWNNWNNQYSDIRSVLVKMKSKKVGKVPLNRKKVFIHHSSPIHMNNFSEDTEGRETKKER